MEESTVRLSTGVTMSVLVLVLGAGAAACGDGDPAAQSPEPALCGSIENLNNDISDMNSIDYTSSAGLDQLQKGISRVKQDLADVKKNAKKEFSDELALTQTSFAAAAASVKAAVNDPSAAAIKAVKASLTQFGAAAQTLVSDVQTTC
jgi:hypothetical protein